MNNNFEENWTILIYLNGNNELEPEMEKVMLSLKAMDIIHNITIVIQIGKESLELVKIIRSMETFNEPDEKWTGVKRYCFKKNKIKFIEDLANKNMADPICMYDFIKWGVENYPANHYMLILGGHSYSLIGAMPDYTQNVPFIMGFPEMSNAITKVIKDLNIKIDLLVLDMCYFNFIEVIYEFGKNKDSSAQNILTYIGEGPIYGLPYDNLIQILEKNIHCTDLNFLIKQFIDNLNFDLVAFRMDYFKLERIKTLFNTLGENYLNQSNDKKISLYKIFSSYTSKEPWSIIINDLKRNIQDLIIHYKKVSNNNLAAINVITELPPDLYQTLFYYRLNFTKQNKWCCAVNNKKISNYDLSVPINSELLPLKLPTEIVYKFIDLMNSPLNAENKKIILKNLLNYKNWV